MEALEKFDAVLQLDKFSHVSLYRASCALLKLSACEEEFSRSLQYKQAAGKMSLCL